MFSYEFCEIFKNIFFTEHLRATASALIATIKKLKEMLGVGLHKLIHTITWSTHKSVKVFKNGPSKICGRQPFKKFEVLWSASADHITSDFLKAVFHKFYLVYSWIHWPKNNSNLYFHLDKIPASFISISPFIAILRFFPPLTFILTPPPF